MNELANTLHANHGGAAEVPTLGEPARNRTQGFGVGELDATALPSDLPGGPADAGRRSIALDKTGLPSETGGADERSGSVTGGGSGFSSGSSIELDRTGLQPAQGALSREGAEFDRTMLPAGQRAEGRDPQRSAALGIADTGFASGLLDTDERALTSDDRASGTEATFVASAPPPRRRPRIQGELRAGAKIGRLMVLRTLGAGGMGIVYAAYDPELDRNVALKLIHAGEASQQAQIRLYREAQALAKLSHPNVVAVHDVGQHEGQVWLAMEFVEGVTLGDWVERERPGWRQVLGLMVQAGQGVAAAHAAGLLHRDLKPDNIMVGDDGRVRVMDFGLARAAAGDEGGGQRQLQEVGAVRRELSIDLTAVGAVMGTPSYMAREQFEGLAADARTDVFALCVTLWEALYGERPFAGATFQTLAKSVVEGQVSSPPAEARVPGWLRIAVERGLAADAECRYPSVDALLLALASDPTRRRRWLGLTLGAAISAAAYLGVSHLQEARVVAGCAAEGASIERVWNPEVRDSLRASLLATGVPYAELVMPQVIDKLDAESSAWSGAREEACLDAKVREAWDEDTLTRSRWCLDARRVELEASVQALLSADAKAMPRILRVTEGLAPVSACRSPHQLRAMPRPPEDVDAVNSIRAELAEARAISATGRHKEGLVVAEKAVVEALEVEWPPLIATARRVKGGLLRESGKPKEGAAELEDAFFKAAEVGAHEVSVDAAIGLMYTVGRGLDRHEEALRWGRHVEVGLANLHEPAVSPRRATAFHVEASVRRAMGDYEMAVEAGDRALVMREELFGREHPLVADTLHSLGSAHWRAGRPERALELGARSLAIFEESFGEDHPKVAISRFTRGGNLDEMGDFAEAKRIKQQALASIERSQGSRSKLTATMLESIGASCFELGEREEAEALHRKALEIREEILAPGHPDIANSLENLAVLAQEEGNIPEAKELLARAYGIYEAALGSDHPDLAANMHVLALVHRDAEEYADSDRLARRAIEIYEEKAGPDHPRLGALLLTLAENALDRGEPTLALESAERALAIREKGPNQGTSLAKYQFALARALSGAGGEPERERARRLAIQARDAYRAAGSDDAMASVQRFLDV